MNKYITPLAENEGLAWQDDGFNPVNRLMPVSSQETQENPTPLLHGFRRFLRTLTPRVRVTGLSSKENLQA